MSSNTITANNPGPAATASTTAATPGNGTQALASLGNNLNDFLNMLMTQLKNQDPTQPLNGDQFTSELVQFASVQQQVNANSNLGTLIQLQQGSAMLQAGSLVGKQVTAQATSLDLKDGSASLTLMPASSGPVAVTVSSPSGVALKTQTVQASASGTDWTWDGSTNNGQSLPDGAYSVAVTDANGRAVPFGVAGMVTSVQKNGSDVTLTLDNGQQVGLNSVQTTK